MRGTSSNGRCVTFGHLVAKKPETQWNIHAQRQPQQLHAIPQIMSIPFRKVIKTIAFHLPNLLAERPETQWNTHARRQPQQSHFISQMTRRRDLEEAVAPFKRNGTTMSGGSRNKYTCSPRSCPFHSGRYPKQPPLFSQNMSLQEFGRIRSALKAQWNTHARRQLQQLHAMQKIMFIPLKKVIKTIVFHLPNHLAKTPETQWNTHARTQPQQS